MILTILLALGTAEIISLVVAAILGALLAAGIFGKKFAPIVKQIKEAVDLYGQSKSESSPGGAKITETERENLRKEALDVLEEAWRQYGGGIIRRITAMFIKK